MKTKKPGREERLAAALRENLKRRKTRVRALADAQKTTPEMPAVPRPNKARKLD